MCSSNLGQRAHLDLSDDTDLALTPLDPSQYDQPSYYEKNGHSIVPSLEWFLESKRQHDKDKGFPIEIMLDCRRAYQHWVSEMVDHYSYWRHLAQGVSHVW